MKNVLKPLAKSILIPLGFTTAASTTSAAIQKKFFWISYDNINNCKRENE